MARVCTGSGKNAKDGAQRAAVELWRAKVPLSIIRSQLKLSELTLRRILAIAKRNPINPVIPKKPGSVMPKKINEETRRLIKKKLQANPSLTAVRLKRVVHQNINFLNLLCNFFLTFMNDRSGFSAFTV